MASKSGVQPVRSSAHKVEAVYSGEDIALGITFQVAMDEKRSLVIQTHTIRDAPAEELNGVLDKVADAVDRVSNRYRLRELLLIREGHMRDLEQQMEGVTQTEARWEHEWSESGRRGPIKLTGTQESARAQAKGMQDNLRRTVLRIDVEIEKVKKALGINAP